MFSGFGGGSSASAAAVPPTSHQAAGNKSGNAAAAASAKDSRDSLYSFDEAKLDSIRKTKPWTQE